MPVATPHISANAVHLTIAENISLCASRPAALETSFTVVTCTPPVESVTISPLTDIMTLNNPTPSPPILFDIYTLNAIDIPCKSNDVTVIIAVFTINSFALPICIPLFENYMFNIQILGNTLESIPI